jgi:hypothetical protein
MRSPITKLAAAAVIAIAAITGVTMWRSTGSGIVLANVLAQVEQITAYMYEMTLTVRGQTPDGRPTNDNVKAGILIAQNYGIRATTDMTDANSGKTAHQEQYVLPQEKAIFMVIPDEKKYVRMELSEVMLEKVRQQNYDPGSMLKQILDCKYESLGRSRVDGIEVEGFQTTDPNYLAGMAGQVDVKIWVDVKTQLPVRSEMNMQVQDMAIHGVVHDFQWDYPATAADFQPAIPADYTSATGGPVKMPAMTEESAIAGLKLFADLTGRYPEKLDLMSLMAELDKQRTGETPSLVKQMEEQVKDLPEAERNKKLLDTLMPIQGAGMFYAMLVKDKKDPAYYGNVVTPQDATQVLLRWKVSDDQYRVIFGNLHAETVDAATLAELEKTLPK